MEIQRCSKCGRRFNYTDIIDSFGWGYKPITCATCGAKHRLKMRYLFILALILILPIFFIGQACGTTTSLKLKIILALGYIIYMVAIVGLYPFIIRYDFIKEQV